MISITSLRPAINAMIPHLPKAAGITLTRISPFLPLAMELAKILYKHREKIGTVASKLAAHTSNGIKKGTDGVVKTVPYLPKKAGRKLRAYLEYLPLALEIVKVSYSKKGKRFHKLTKKFPNEVKQKINNMLKRHRCSCCSNLLSKFQKL
ncbi:hypothetical protein J4G08_15460 [Candidatus Poribacteria bacterium]|nr:hypothetical protein [Candidatus Poribacteria bacterium]